MRSTACPASFLVLVLAVSLLSGCTVLENAARNFDQFRQGLRDAQAERDEEARLESERAAAARQQAERQLEISDPKLFRLRQEWARLRPRYTGDRYTVAPRVSAPYAAGVLADGLLEDALNMTRFVRLLAGLPGTIELSQELTRQAQHGAVVLAARDEMTHYPSKPAGMDNAFYEMGATSTATSNLNWSTDPSDTPAGAVLSFMDDSNTRNIDRIGHRRWVLSPYLRFVGFGFAQSQSGAFYTTMQVFDTGNRDGADFDLTLWPSEGSFPVEFFAQDHAWSVLFNPDRYGSVGSVRVLVTRIGDGARWELTERDGDRSGSYLHVDTDGYGYQSAIIFRPGPGFRVAAGDTYTVSVSGLRAKDGTPRDLEYSVTFVRLDAPPG